MPLRLNVGLSKKVGLPDYGSLGAHCNVEVELSNSLLEDDLDALHRHVQRTYVACSQAVGDELTRQLHEEPRQASAQTKPSSKSNGNGRSADGSGNGQRASQKQVEYINQLARQIHGLGVRRLETLANKMCSKPIADLTSLDASGLIDCLKAIKAGDIDLTAALNGATT